MDRLGWGRDRAEMLTLGSDSPTPGQTSRENHRSKAHVHPTVTEALLTAAKTQSQRDAQQQANA